MTTVTDFHNPIAAYGKTAAKTVSGSVSEGAKSFTITNTGTTIDVGHPVFISKSDDTLIQFVGLCLTSSTTVITTEYGAATALGTSAKIWRPTYYAHFPLGVVPDGGTVIEEMDGTSTVVARGAGEIYPFQHSDAQVAVSFTVQGYAEDRAAWTTFRQTNRSYGTSAFSIGWYDQAAGTTRVDRVILDNGNHSSSISSNKVTTIFSFRVFITDTGTYVTS